MGGEGALLRERPDVLVLGAGGTLGEAWMRGLLSGARSAAGTDFAACEAFVGTSAGSIVAAVLAAGVPLPASDRLAERWAAAAPAEGEPGGAGGGGEGARARLARLPNGALRAGLAAAAPLAPLALAGGAPVGRAARRRLLARAPRPTRRLDGLAAQLGALGARFDGRLRVAVVDRESGARVMLGAPGAPQASVRDAVLASCAVPWLFAPVAIGGREYVDGGVWSPTNLDAAPLRRGARVLCLTPLAAITSPASTGSVLGVLRAVSQSAVHAEALAARARGAHVEIVTPDARAAEAMGPRVMDASRSEAVLDAAFAQGVRLAGGGRERVAAA